MDQTMLRMMELSGQGYYCSQILLMLALEAQGKTNDDLIRAVGGLANGCGFSGGTCGALTGGACLLSLYAGKGTDDDYQDESLTHLLRDLGAWFSRTYGDHYGGITCEAIVGDRTDMRQRCAAIVAETYAKTLELLAASGYDISAGK
jgi:C_GCAxxG_C_C family probable redox protein